MNFKIQRNILLVFWFSVFCLNIIILLYLYLDNWIEKDNFFMAIKKINNLYAPYLGAITLFYWGKKENLIENTNSNLYLKTQFYLALFLSITWNVLILVFIVPLLFQMGVIEDSIENIENVSSMFSWLVAGAIGYYFGNVTKT